MVLLKHFAFSALLLFLIGIPSLVKAQQRGTAGRAETQSQSAKGESATPRQDPSPTDQQLQSSPTKENSDRLPFMVDTDRENRETAPSTTGLMLRTLGALLLIIGLIVAAAWGMKRFGGPRFGAAREDAPELAVLSSIALGERRSLSIVRFGHRTLLLGTTPQAVTLLAESEQINVTTPVRSVAEILNDKEPVHFSAELITAGQRLDETLGILPAGELRQ